MLHSHLPSALVRRIDQQLACDNTACQSTQPPHPTLVQACVRETSLFSQPWPIPNRMKQARVRAIWHARSYLHTEINPSSGCITLTETFIPRVRVPSTLPKATTCWTWYSWFFWYCYRMRTDAWSREIGTYCEGWIRPWL